MDAFETRMQFLTQLRRLTSAAQSINKVVAFLLKQSAIPNERTRHNSRPTVAVDASSASESGNVTHGEADLWECIMEELEKASINARMNIFYMLDSLLDQSLAIGVESYRRLVSLDIDKVVQFTVPTSLREGVLNRMSTMQVLNGWKTRRLLPITKLDSLLDDLRSATFPTIDAPTPSTQDQVFSKTDILRRIEDDRERHKRLRERIWVLPIPSLLDMSSNPNPSLSTLLSKSTTSPATPDNTSEPKLISLASYTKERQGSDIPQDDSLAISGSETALDVEFEQAWEVLCGQSESTALSSHDIKAMQAENVRCFG